MQRNHQWNKVCHLNSGVIIDSSCSQQCGWGFSKVLEDVKVYKSNVN